MIRIVLVLMTLAGLSLSMVGCTNTVRGMGRDMEGAGNSMQDYNARD